MTDKHIRHSQLEQLIRIVKSLADLNLNNQLDLLIDEKVEREGVLDEDDEMIWECESCPDLYHGKEKVSPGEDDYLNMSFPGINQKEVDPNLK